MADVFHKFSSLPPELRDLIWEFAVRPDSPGVHFFTLDDGPPGKYAPTTSCPCRLSSCSSSNCSRTECLHGLCVGTPLFVGAPATAPELQVTQIADDPSTCLVDAGLWMACKASRAVVSRQLGMSSWRGRRDDYWQRWTEKGCTCPWVGRDCDCDSDDVPRFGRFWHGDDVDRTPVVFPRNDLFCLRRTRGSGRPELASRIRRLLSSNAFCEAVHHWAFEFDETWDSYPCPLSPRPTSLRPDDVDVDDFYSWLGTSLEKARLTCHVYLIDYAVRLKPGAERKMTFHGNGCKFVESDDVVADSVRDGVKSLIQELESWSTIRSPDFFTQVRLLACVKD